MKTQRRGGAEVAESRHRTMSTPLGFPLSATSASRRLCVYTSALCVWVLAFGIRGLLAADAPRLDRDDLRLYRDAAGQTQRVEKLEQWKMRRAEILRGMQTIMGPLPGAEKRGPLDVKIEEESEVGAHVRRRITYQSEPGGRAQAWLLIPKGALAGDAKFPAVLCLHPTNSKIGNRTVVEPGAAANRAYAYELAERGYVALAPAYPQLADYQPDLGALGYASGTMKAVWDNVRGLDLLETLPFVKSEPGFGAIGHSLGGHNAVFTAVFDERIQVVVSSCGLDSFLDYYGGNIKGWTQPRYMPRLADYLERVADVPFDFQELIGALAPRHVFVSAPLGDTNFNWQSVDRIARAALPIFKLHGAADRLRVVHPDCAHDFPPEIREDAYRWLDAALRAR
jgi:dienelactone hydrolase